jgi:hypothetical protein
LPINPEAEAAIRLQLARLGAGEHVPLIVIGSFTERQFAAINESRVAADLHELAQNEIVFIGRHLHKSRRNDGYSVEDIAAQIISALCEEAEAQLDKMASCTQNPNPRDDGYGNKVHDRAVFEMTAKKPRAELFSVIPKGDTNKPKKKAAN